jgi:hypothetical protein
MVVYSHLEAVVQIAEVWAVGDDVQPHLARGLLVEIQVGVVYLEGMLRLVLVKIVAILISTSRIQHPPTLHIQLHLLTTAELKHGDVLLGGAQRVEPEVKVGPNNQVILIVPLRLLVVLVIPTPVMTIMTKAIQVTQELVVMAHSVVDEEVVKADLVARGEVMEVGAQILSPATMLGRP